MVKTSPSNVGVIPGQAAKTPHASWPKNQNMNRSNIVTDSIKTLKMVHIKKIFKKYMLLCVEEFGLSLGGWVAGWK